MILSSIIFEVDSFKECTAVTSFRKQKKKQRRKKKVTRVIFKFSKIDRLGIPNEAIKRNIKVRFNFIRHGCQCTFCG